MKSGRFIAPLLLLALASFPACGEKKEEDKKITIQFNVSKETEEKKSETAPGAPQKPPAQAGAQTALAPAERKVSPQPPAVRGAKAAARAPLPPEAPEANEVKEKIEAAKRALDQRQAAEAIRLLNEAKRLAPDHPRLYPMLARAHQMNRDREGARAAIQEGLVRNPDNALLLYLRGFLYHREGNAHLARQDLRRALEIDPNLPMAQRARQTLQDIEEGKPPRRPAARRQGPGGGPPGVDDF
ncbi:MAG: tetratricopeptide repeat protein [Nitrospirota bacterium]